MSPQTLGPAYSVLPKPAVAGFTLFEEPDTEEVELGTIELPDEPCPWGKPDYVDRWDCHERKPK